jgi:hypothetical protein
MYDEEQAQDTTPMNLAEIHRISEELIETGKIPVIKRRHTLHKVKDATLVGTNIYLRVPEIVMLIRTPETETDARITALKASSEKGWMIVECFTVMKQFTLEVTANWPIITYLQWYP